MTKEDKKLIADYMGWKRGCDYHVPCVPAHEEVCDDCRYVVYKNFDLNDAGLVVAEMQKRGDWNRFLNHGFNSLIDVYGFMAHNFIATLFRAENFFGAMAAWLMEEKKC